MINNRFPPGWDEERVRRVLAHYETQTDEEAAAEDEKAFEGKGQAMTEYSQPRCSINDIQLKDPEGIAQTLIAQYGTEDAAEIVTKMRRRRRKRRATRRRSLS